MIFLLRTSGRLIQKVARLITQGGQVDLKGSSTDSKTCTQPTKIFLLHTSSDRAQRNPLHSKAVRQGLKTPSFDPKVAQPIPKTTRQDPKTTQLVPKGDSTESQGAPMITRQPNRSRQSDSASFKRRPAGTQAHLQDTPGTNCIVSQVLPRNR